MTIKDSQNSSPDSNDTDFSDESTNTSNNNSNILKLENEDSKSKTYLVKNLDWYCVDCDIYCNSESQFAVHMISQKHKLIVDENKRKLMENITNDVEAEGKEVSMHNVDDNNNLIQKDLNIGKAETIQSIRARTNFSIEEIAQNPLAIRFNIDAVKYLITEDKKQGKFEKFGFYCKTCNAYMTGQIQLIMHVRGAKHQYFHPDEIPNYKPTKVYNPFYSKNSQFHSNNINHSKKSQINNNLSDITSTPKNTNYNYQPNYSKNLSKNKHSIEQIVNYHMNQPGGYRANSYNQQSYANKCFSNTQMYNINNSSPALFNDQQGQYNFQEQVQQLAYNFKVHPVYAYQMYLNQRLKQQQNDIEDGKNLNEIHQPGTNIHYTNGNQFNDQYFNYNQQTPSMIPQYANISTPTPQFTQKPSYQHLNNAPMKFSQNQSPIPYMLPQNSTPPNSFNQTPINLQSNNQQQSQQQKKTDEKMFNSFNVFNTPPASFSYYPSIQHHQ